MQASARLRYMKGSAQKVRLVVDLVRGKKVNDAVAILRHSNKAAARDVLKALRSAVANAEQKEAQSTWTSSSCARSRWTRGPRRSVSGRLRWGARTAFCTARVT